MCTSTFLHSFYQAHLLSEKRSPKLRAVIVCSSLLGDMPSVRGTAAVPPGAPAVRHCAARAPDAPSPRRLLPLWLLLRPPPLPSQPATAGAPPSLTAWQVQSLIVSHGMMVCSRTKRHQGLVSAAVHGMSRCRFQLYRFRKQMTRQHWTRPQRIVAAEPAP